MSAIEGHIGAILNIILIIALIAWALLVNFIDKNFKILQKLPIKKEQQVFIQRRYYE